MITITFIESDGTEHAVATEADGSLMQAAINHSVPGILAECGGACACATCHCYIAPEWAERVGAAQSYEQDMLECVVDPDARSRLSCQIELTPALDGLTVFIPVAQA